MPLMEKYFEMIIILYILSIFVMLFGASKISKSSDLSEFGDGLIFLGIGLISLSISMFLTPL